uniref:Uncharacterized protein n=1 Tax=Arion vulgaris TaxID=1028688 RepID=A0A0B6ZC89_9EUPU
MERSSSYHHKLEIITNYHLSSALKFNLSTNLMVSCNSDWGWYWVSKGVQRLAEGSKRLTSVIGATPTPLPSKGKTLKQEKLLYSYLEMILTWNKRCLEEIKT